MKAKVFIPLVLAATLCSAHGTTVLYDWAIDVDGIYSEPFALDPIPGGVNLAAFDTITGLGTITMTVTGAGSHHLSLLLDIEIDEAINGFTNEIGSTGGSPAAGQTWEMDDPNAGFIFGDLMAGNLTNVDYLGGLSADVSMALGWDLNLLAGETATASFVVGATPPTSGFYIQQNDPASRSSIYVSSSWTTAGAPSSVPDGGGTLVLLLTSMAGLALFRIPSRSARK